MVEEWIQIKWYGSNALIPDKNAKEKLLAGYTDTTISSWPKLQLSKQGQSPCSVLVKALDCGIVENQFELQLHY